MAFLNTLIWTLGLVLWHKLDIVTSYMVTWLLVLVKVVQQVVDTMVVQTCMDHMLAICMIQKVDLMVVL